MTTLQTLYPIIKPVGHLSIVCCDIALVFYYYRLTPERCFFELKLWVYGQLILHSWFAFVSMAHFCDFRPSPSNENRGKIISLGLKFWWILYAFFLFYSAKECIPLSPFLYGWVWTGALVLAVSAVFDWKTARRRNTEERGLIPPALPEKALASVSGHPEVCPICLDLLDPTDTVSVLSCRHFYHPACIYEWLLQRLQCPVCRKPVVSPGAPQESRA